MSHPCACKPRCKTADEPVEAVLPGPAWYATNDRPKRGQSNAEDMDQTGRHTTAQERLFANHDMLCAKAKTIMEAKNKDYASASDPYRNFRMFGALGILVRMSDKLARLRNFVENGSYTVKDEGVVDTTCDLINYANILYSYLEEEKSAG